MTDSKQPEIEDLLEDAGFLSKYQFTELYGKKYTYVWEHVNENNCTSRTLHPNTT